MIWDQESPRGDSLGRNDLLTRGFLFAIFISMELKIQAKLRQASGKQNKKLRKAGILPAVVYGRNKETLSLEILNKDFQNTMSSPLVGAQVNLYWFVGLYLWLVE